MSRHTPRRTTGLFVCRALFGASLAAGLSAVSCLNDTEAVDCSAEPDSPDCSAATGPDSCEYALDGVCDDPQYCDPGTDASDCGGTVNTCANGLCVNVSNTFFSDETCADGTSRCSYANVFFQLLDDDVDVTDLTQADVNMQVNGRELGVEGTKELSGTEGLIVRLLLDASFSITEANAESAVRDGAMQFIRALPSASHVGVAQFASESTVPTFICSDGSEGTSSLEYSSPAFAEAAVRAFYSSYDTQTSDAQTKIYDAVDRWSAFTTPSRQDLLLLPRIMLVFTDGEDTASALPTADAARSAIQTNDPDLKVYAIGLGSGVDVAALDTISEGRTFVAENPQALQAAFSQVAADLSSIYHLKILVAESEEGAAASLSINYGGEALNVSVAMGFVDAVGLVPPPGEGSCN